MAVALSENEQLDSAYSGQRYTGDFIRKPDIVHLTVESNERTEKEVCNSGVIVFYCWSLS